MTKHSKNNTASSIFTYAEYKRLDYGTKKQRLGNESMRRFDACALCLSRARDPVACRDGHLFCRECVVVDLLSQKKSLAAQKSKLEALKADAEVERARARDALRQTALEDFERTQLGVGVRAQTGSKRKAFSQEQESAVTKNANANKNENTIGNEKEKEKEKEGEKPRLPGFWLPSLTPTHIASAQEESTKMERKLKDAEREFGKGKTVCRGGKGNGERGESGAGHVLAMKDLVPVKFTFWTTTAATDTPSRSSTGVPEDTEPMCPSCKRRLSNSILMFLSKPCGHVTCKTCTDTLVRPSAQCVVCDVSLWPSGSGGRKGKDKKEKEAAGGKEREKEGKEAGKGKDGELELVELKREGTGFAGGGMAETSKAGIAFQG